jgi:dihydrofolate reductase
MGRLVYAAITSLDGYTADASGDFSWSMPDAEVHAAVNDLERASGTYLYGRRMYEVMAAWETIDAGPGAPPEQRDFAQLWRAAEKIVFSRTLDAVTTPRTGLERTFDAAAVRALVDASADDVSIGGATLAAEAIRAGIVDEWHQFLSPVIVGGGTHWLPRDVRVDLELVGERRYAGGVVQLHYRSR